MVLSTLHTNDAAASVTRLTDIGVEAYKISAALKGIVAQRLLRRLCTLCKEPARYDEVPEKLRAFFPPDCTLYRAVGCPECSMTGYRGRHAVHEMLTVDEDLQARIAAAEPVDQLIEAARAGGMRSLWESGVEHAKLGHTTIAELLRVLEAPSEDRQRTRGAAGSVTRESPSVLPPPPREVPPPSLVDTPSVVPPAYAPMPSAMERDDYLPPAIDRDPLHSPPSVPHFPVPASQEMASVTGHVTLSGFTPPAPEAPRPTTSQTAINASAKAPPPRRTMRMPPESASVTRPMPRPTVMPPTPTPPSIPLASAPPAPLPRPTEPVTALPIASAWDFAREPVSTSGPSGSAREPNSGGASRRIAHFDGPAPKILLVEDEDQLRRVMKDLLEREGFAIFEAGDGVQALDQVDRIRPDAVVLDLNLPRLDGFQVLERLRAREGTQKLPVIVLTAQGDEESEVRVFKIGANDFLTKPFRARALSTRLQAVLGRTAIPRG